MVLCRPTRPFRTNTQKGVLFIIGDQNAKVGSQETPGVTGKFGLGIQNESGHSLIEFCQDAEYIMRNAEQEETQAGIKIAWKNINKLRYADDTTLMAESEEELKSLLMKVKEESEKVVL